jgi:hypothetical protein
MGRKDDEPRGQQPYYKRLFEGLNTGTFLEDHKDQMREIMTIGYSKLKAGDIESGIATGIATCIHYATTVVMLGSDQDHLQKARKEIEAQEVLKGKDWTTTLTIAALHYILDYGDRNFGEEFQKISPDIRTAIQNQDYISKDAMVALGIKDKQRDTLGAKLRNLLWG